MCTALEDLRQEGVQEGIDIGEERGVHKASEAILTLVNRMLGSEDAGKIPLIQGDLELRQKMMEKYQVSL